MPKIMARLLVIGVLFQFQCGTGWLLRLCCDLLERKKHPRLSRGLIGLIEQHLKKNPEART